MLKHAANLSDSNEYFIVWAGETNARPWGAKADGFSLFPELELAADGIVVNVDLSAVPSSHTTGTTATVTFTFATGEVEANEWSGVTMRMGSNILAVTGYGVLQAHEASSSGVFDGVVIWTIGVSGGGSGDTNPGYFVREARKWGSYPQVRILTPYQPVATTPTDIEVRPLTTDDYDDGGRSITLPVPYSGTTGATSFDDVGVLLPLSFFEGIDGFGISEGADSSSTDTHVIQTITGTVVKTWEFENDIDAGNVLNGGYVMVDWEDDSVMKRSWAPIVDSSVSDFDVVSADWLGDGDPGVDPSVIKRYTAWVPYFTDSPYAYLPGEGYSYPNHDMMPCGTSSIGGFVHNRPRAVTGSAYGDTFGALLVAASRLSAATGKRVNVVNLAVTDATLAPSNDRNAYGFKGKLGWWGQDDHATWDPADSSSLYARLDKLLRTVLPNAMLAEANTKPLRCLGIVFNHGETDALGVYSRESYGRAQRYFIDSLRRLIDGLGYNPYENGAEIPYVQPRIAVLPYGIDGSYDRDTDRGGTTTTYDADQAGMVNTAIEESTLWDEFATVVRVDDLPRLSTDPGIYDGVGEAGLGSRIGDSLSLLIDHGLGYGSAALDDTQTRLLDICNMALSHIGDAGQITSLSDGSEQARLCKRFLPEARDELLEVSTWGFALRRRHLLAIQKPESRLFQNWNYCYVLPAEAIFSFKVLGPVAGPEAFEPTDVIVSGYSATYAENNGSLTAVDAPNVTRTVVHPGSTTGGGGVSLPATTGPLLLVSEVGLDSQPFTVEQSPFGGRYIFTNQERATLQYVARVVDADLYSPLFASALATNLGSKLASVHIKGKEGEAVSGRLLAKTSAYLRAAASSDANQQLPIDSQSPFGFMPDHLAHRGARYDSVGGIGNNLTYFPSGMRVD